MAVYDDQEQKSETGVSNPSDDELRRLTGISHDEEGAMDREAHNGAAADIAERNGLAGKGKSNDGGDTKADDDQVGKGYSDDEKEPSRLRKMVKSKSKTKKRMAIAGALAGGGGGLAVVLFFALLPLKIESIVSNLENRAGAASEQAIGKESGRLFKGYVINQILPSLGKHHCHSTIDAGCVANAKGKGPIAQLYRGWKNDKMEQKLAQRGLSFGVSGSNYYINVDGKKLDFSNEEKLKSFLSDPNTTTGNKHEIEQALSKHLKEGTLWDRIYYRFRLAPFLNKKYGIRHCINACKPINKFTDSVSTKKKAAKAYIIQRVVSPLSESYGLIMQCVLESHGCGTALKPAKPGDTAPESEIDSRLQQQLSDYIAKHAGKESLEDLVKIADDIGKDGFAKVIARELAKKIGDILGHEVSGEAASKAVPVIGWVLALARIASFVHNIGPMLRYLSYAANAAAAAQLFAAYQTVASETKSGQIDAVQLGSFNDALSTNLSGSKDDQSDATQTPLYQSMMDQTPSQGISFLGGSGLSSTAFADSGDNNTGYTCDSTDDSGTRTPVPKGKLVCPEEKLDRGNGFANALSKDWDKLTGWIPGFNFMIKAINKVGGAFADISSSVFNGACKVVDTIDIFGNPCHDALNAIGKLGAKLMTWLINKLVSTPITDNMSGGRTFDMMAAGADVSFNSSCQENLGCKQVSDKEAANIQTEHLNQLQQDFQHRSMFARMFSTDTPYSFVSRLAMIMPSSLTNAGNQVASTIMQNPFSTFGQLFSGLFAPHRVMAGVPAGDPFGVPQNAYPTSDIPDNPQQFWDNNCVKGPYGIWNEDQPVGQQLDITPWLNNETHYQMPDGSYVNFAPHGKNVEQNTNTGQAMFVHSNPCLLILGSVQSAGGLSDPSLLPQDSMSSAGATGGSQFRIATFNIQGASHTKSTWQARADKSIAVIQANQPDVIGFQEFQESQQKYFMQRLSGYDIYPKISGNNNAIVWNTSKFTLIDSGIQPNLHYFCNKLDAPYVKLQDNATGQQFYFLNTHDPANSSNNACASQAAKYRYQNALEHVKFMKQLEGQGVPVFYTGDFNSRYDLKSGGGNGTPYQGKAANLTYCILTKAGYNDGYDAFSGRSVKCPNTTPAPTQPGIDHLYLSQSVQVTGFKSVDHPENGSDVHPTLFFDVAIPGAGNPGSKFRLATYNMRVHTTSAQNQTAVNNMKSHNFDIVGMQELSYAQIFNSVKGKLGKAGYDIYPESFTGTWDMNSTAIAWNSSKFSLVKTDQITYPAGDHADCPGKCQRPGAPTTSPIIWLQDKQTGQQFIVMNIHTYAFNDYNGKQLRYQAAQAYTTKIKALKNDNLPIMLVGDFNEGYGPSDKTGNWRYTAYCMLETQGLMVSPYVSKPGDYCKDGGQSGHRPDHILTSPGVEGTGQYLTAPASKSLAILGTDHVAVPYADIVIPGSSTTGKGGSSGGSGTPSPGKSFVGADGYSYGWCTGYVDHVLARHAAHYSAGHYPDGKAFASSLKKYGYTVNHTPAVHAVVSFPGPPYGFVGDRYAGHVALVGQVNKDGSIVVEEFNFNNKMHYGRHTVSAGEAKTLTYAHTEVGWH